MTSSQWNRRVGRSQIATLEVMSGLLRMVLGTIRVVARLARLPEVGEFRLHGVEVAAIRGCLQRLRRLLEVVILCREIFRLLPDGGKSARLVEDVLARARREPA